jgi:hypothetical protein
MVLAYFKDYSGFGCRQTSDRMGGFLLNSQNTNQKCFVLKLPTQLYFENNLYYTRGMKGNQRATAHNEVIESGLFRWPGALTNYLCKVMAMFVLYS